MTDPITQYLASRPTVPGAGLLITDFEGDVIHEQYWGTYDRTTVVPIASASKWLSAGVIRSSVGDIAAYLRMIGNQGLFDGPAGCSPPARRAARSS